MRNKVVTVFGGSGFIGRHVVRKLAGLGATGRVPTRHPERAISLKPMGGVGQVVLERWDATESEEIARHTVGSTHLVSLVGILAERRAGDFGRLQGRLPGAIGAAAAEIGAEGVTHVSAIGASRESASAYARTKAEGEEALRSAFPRAVVLRPSVVFGPEDSFFNRFAKMAQISPALPLIGGGHTRFQPVYVGDVADAVATALFDERHAGGTFELGGPKVYTFRELMLVMLRTLKRRRLLLNVPFGVATAQARLLQLLPEPPLTVDQVQLLQRDNVATAGVPGLAELGVRPTPVEAIIPTYLSAYARQQLRIHAG
jgi:NADH dehydrogenase